MFLKMRRLREYQFSEDAAFVRASTHKICDVSVYPKLGV